jgi:replicative DNA helicase
MQDQMNLLQNYVINEAKKQANEFNSMPTQSNFNYLIEQLQQLSSMRIDKDNPTDNYLMEVMDNILSDRPKDFIKTGIKSIDNKIMGFERGQLNVLGAQS